MSKWICTIFLLFLAGIFQGQTVLYSENFNSSLNTCTAVNGSSANWVWNNSCARSGLTGHSPPGAALFIGVNCFFGNQFQTVSGNLISPTIAIGQAGGVLTFNYFRQGETQFYWDVLSVQVSNNNGATYTTILSTASGGGLIGYAMNTPTQSLVWNQACFNLSSYINQTVTLRFNFNSLDGILNDYDGVYVDDIVITEPYSLNVAQSANSVCPGTAVTLSTNAVGGYS